MNKNIKTLLDILYKKPLFVNLVISRNCNLKCKQCNIWKYPKKDILNFNQRKKIINALFSWLGKFKLNITGGEPFAHPDTIKLIKYAAIKGISITVNTNGVLITKKIVDKLYKYRDKFHLSFSIDGAKSKTHDYLRGKKGTFATVLKNIDYLSRKTSRAAFTITTVISGKNVSELTDLCDLAIKIHSRCINFQPLDLYSFQNKKNSLSEFKKHVLWPKNYELFKNKFMKLIEYKRSNKGYIIKNSLEELQSFLKYFHNPFNKNQKCNNNSRTIIINRNGNVSLCTSDSYIFGNIITDNIPEKYYSQEVKKLKTNMSDCNLPCKTLGCHKKKDIKYYYSEFIRRVNKFSDYQK